MSEDQGQRQTATTLCQTDCLMYFQCLMAKGLAVTEDNCIPDFVCANCYCRLQERKPAYEKIKSHRDC